MSTLSTAPRRRPAWRFPVLAIAVMVGVLAARCHVQPEDTTGPYALLQGGVTWPCAPIHYQISDAELPDDFLAVVNGAVGKVSAASGFRFYYDGLTPDRDFAARVRTPGPVLIGFANPDEIRAFKGEAIGVANRAVGSTGAVAGTIKLDATKYQEYPDLDYRQAVVMHELGHILGLDHVDDPGEIMNPTVSAMHFGPGDLAGLKQLYATSCPDGRTPY